MSKSDHRPAAGDGSPRFGHHRLPATRIDRKRQAESGASRSIVHGHLPPMGLDDLFHQEQSEACAASAGKPDGPAIERIEDGGARLLSDTRAPVGDDHPSHSISGHEANGDRPLPWRVGQRVAYEIRQGNPQVDRIAVYRQMLWAPDEHAGPTD